jgi:hypothetical protein
MLIFKRNDLLAVTGRQRRRWLYTAITRAADTLTIIG